MAGPRFGATRVASLMHQRCESMRDCMELSCLSSHGDERSYTYDTARHIIWIGAITPLATRSRFVRRHWVACGHSAMLGASVLSHHTGHGKAAIRMEAARPDTSLPCRRATGRIIRISRACTHV